MSVLNPVIKLKETYQDFIGSHVSGKTKEETFELAARHIAELGLPPKYPGRVSTPVVRWDASTGDDRPGGAAEARIIDR